MFKTRATTPNQRSTLPSIEFYEPNLRFLSNCHQSLSLTPVITISGKLERFWKTLNIVLETNFKV